MDLTSSKQLFVMYTTIFHLFFDPLQSVPVGRVVSLQLLCAMDVRRRLGADLSAVVDGHALRTIIS